MFPGAADWGTMDAPKMFDIFDDDWNKKYNI